MADIEVGSVDASQVLTSTIWPTGSHVRLLNVPWDSVYRDVVAWESAAARDEWFAAQSGSWFASNFQNLRPGEPIDVPVPYSSVYQYNYIVITNPQQPVEYEGPERSYFYFITNAQYLSPQATRLTVQLDVMTTYAGGITFGRAFVDRGHVAMANENLRKGTLTGHKLLTYCDNPEGLDVGSALVPGEREYVPFSTSYRDDDPSGNQYDWVIVISTTNLEADPGTIDKPTLKTGQGAHIDGIPGGCECYLMSFDSYMYFASLSQDYSWVTQGIIAIYSFPDRFIDKDNLASQQKTQLLGGKTSAFSDFTCYSGLKSSGHWSWRNSLNRPTLATIDDIYGKIKEAVAEGFNDLVKFLVYPYSVIELSVFDGNPVYLKPQFIQGDKLTFEMLCCSLLPFAKVGVFPANYGSPYGGSDVVVDKTYYSEQYRIPVGDFLDSAVWVTDLPQYSLVNNNYYIAMASSAYTRAYNYQSAGWGITKANLQAENAYTNATMWANTRQQAAEATADTQFSNAANAQYWNNQINNVNALGGAFSAGASFMGSGGLLGAATKDYYGLTADLAGVATKYYANTVTNNYQTANTQAMAMTETANAALYGGTGREAAINDRNTALAVSSGDYENQIAAINATVQDAALTPPSTVGQAGGNGFNRSNGLVGMMVTIKTVAGSAKRAIADYWRRYGYSVRRYMNLGNVYHMLCMSKFAYWKVLESNITCASANETERETMRGIMEKGVTLWASPELIGTTALTDNTPRDGYSY